MSIRHEIEKKLSEGYGLPYGPSRVEAFEQAMRLADQHELVELSFSARQALVDSASLSGRWELVPVHFAWLLATCDKHPEKFDEYRVVLEYLSATQSLAFFSRVSKADILAAQTDLESRFRKLGLELKEVERIKLLNAIEMGDFETGSQLLDALTARGYYPTRGGNHFGKYSHRLYCRGWFEILRGNEEDGLADLRDVYENQAVDTIIHGFALSISLPVLLRRQETDGLEQLARRCDKEVHGRANMIEPYTEYMQFLARSENIDVNHFSLREYVSFGESIQNELDALGFFQTARYCAAVVEEFSRYEELRFPSIVPEERRTAETCVAYYEKRARRLAEAFDRRNENDFYLNRLEASLKWERFPFPIEILG